MQQMNSEEQLTEDEFRSVALDALDELPVQFVEKMNTVAVVINTDHENRNLMGVFDPRGGMRRIVLFKDTISRVGGTPEGIRREIRKTVLHEVGHYFGLNERQLRELGYG